MESPRWLGGMIDGVSPHGSKPGAREIARGGLGEELVLRFGLWDPNTG